MAKKKRTKSEKNAFVGSLDRLGGKELMQHGAEESSRKRNPASIALAATDNQEAVSCQIGCNAGPVSGDPSEVANEGQNW